MSKTVNTTWDAPDWDEVLASQLVKESTWQDQAARQHHLFSRVGARVPLLYRTDTGWETTSGTYTSTDESSLGVDLDTITGCLTLARSITISSSQQRGVLLRCFGQDVDVQVTLFDVASNASLGTAVISCGSSGGGGEWASAQFNLAEASWAVATTPKIIGVTLQGKTSSSTGYLLHAYCHEIIATAAQLPT